MEVLIKKITLKSVVGIPSDDYEKFRRIFPSGCVTSDASLDKIQAAGVNMVHLANHLVSHAPHNTVMWRRLMRERDKDSALLTSRCHDIDTELKQHLGSYRQYRDGMYWVHAKHYAHEFEARRAMETVRFEIDRIATSRQFILRWAATKQ
jgi:hypothetical protein